ncbi:nuclear transport factor 2 family protein [Streptomyces sp. N2-109]|uniref:Nuclear transport factor 2 family protein n=1 Tax=Streptomyces gossypii TaxID=2883101 RepID=A0ABT2JX78_9ACTN|nr:nuclear transport factor 2 family protein [Streptomyces gossypii]MCT2592278.1 nuclear transport factor 2 family protein [Streptomyces gossypii]
MSDPERNKQTVRAFVRLAFVDRQPADAVAKYIGATYINHNPRAVDGPDSFVGFVSRFPHLKFDIKRLVAEGDTVVMHSLMTIADDDRGMAVVDIFRLDEAGKLVEHWDVQQPIPETSANDNTMF